MTTGADALRRKILEAYDAPTSLRKVAAIEAALDMLDAALGAPNTLGKADGESATFGELERLQAQIANIKANDALHASYIRKPHR